jgi:hypothetical protein
MWLYQLYQDYTSRFPNFYWTSQKVTNGKIHGIMGLVFVLGPMGQMPCHHLQPQPESGHAVGQLGSLEQGLHAVAPAAGDGHFQRRLSADGAEDALLPERLRVEDVQVPPKKLSEKVKSGAK